MDGESNRWVGIEEVLMLLRHQDNLELRAKVLEERRAARALGLDTEALQQLRDIFTEQDRNKEPGRVRKKEGRIPVQGAHLILKTLGVVQTQTQRTASIAAVQKA